MKKLAFILSCLMSFSILTGCGLLSNKGPELVYKELSKKERTLLRVTGNRVALYEIKNMPENVEYDLTVSYELYENGEKVKEDVITGAATENVEKNQKISLAINLNEDKIDSIIATGGLESGSESAKIDLSNLSYIFLSEDTELNFGDEIYIYQGSKGNTVNYVSLGTQVDESLVKDRIKNQEYDVFIKISLNYR